MTSETNSTEKTSTPTGVTQLASQYWGFAALAIWGGTLYGLGLIRLDGFGLEESAAQSLVLIWSIFDRIANPILAVGVPDFRALLFVPLGAYWAGSVIAAKVYTALLAFGTATLLYKWSKRTAGAESSLAASALILISPFFLNEIDALGAGIFTLLTFAVGASINNAYQRSQGVFGTLYFVQMIWVAIAVSIHPMGLAYPIALAWTWTQEPRDPRVKRQLISGLALVTSILIALRGGWRNIEWLNNPAAALGLAHQPFEGMTEPNWIIGNGLLLLVALVIWKDRKFLVTDFVGKMLLVGAGIGLFVAGDNWAVIISALVLYRGSALLMGQSQTGLTPYSSQKQGVVLIALLACSTAFMLADKARYLSLKAHALGPQDRIIQLLANDAADPALKIRIASQWPARTMIATKREVFPLPMAAKTGEELLANIKGITHLVFDHNDPKNKDLARNIADVGGATETVVLDEGGVIVQVRQSEPSVAQAPRPPTDQGVRMDVPAAEPGKE